MLAAVALPILVAKCLSCHNAEAKVNGFDLSTRQALLAGGKSGAAVVPGDPVASRLMQYVTSGRMPPARPLEPGEVDTLRQWIAEGAPYSEAKLQQATRPRAGLDWWALQSPHKPELPGGSATNPIDRFLEAKLQEKGLAFSPAADHRSLIRRLHLGLAGLPPKSEDLAKSYEDTVEHLLASPHYGERWGRYWLDVVRYGESDGGEHNHERMTAWKYRDYVVDAFNTDKPYNQFVREQIAGDIMEPANPKLVAATGFLVAGPWDSVTKEINRDELMRKTLRQDELDDFVSTTFATFQALTVNCARCHDHKFDPIPTRDYYRLTAAFRGVTYGERDVYSEQQKKDRDALTAPIRKQLASLRDRIDTIEAAPRTRLLEARYRGEQDARAGRKHIPVNPIYNRNRLAASASAARFRFVITAQQGKVEPRVDRIELLPAGLLVENWKGGKAATDDAPQIIELSATAPVTVNELRWSADSKTGKRDGMPRVYRLEAFDDGTTWRTISSSLDHDVPAEFDLPEVTDEELIAALPPAAVEERRRLREEQQRVQSELDRVPPLETVHAAKLEPKMLPAHLLDRGSVSKPLDEVAPGTLSCIRQLPADLATGTDAERRMALAQWLTDPRNPLTARVIVNRVWYQHFGTGIVNTPSDFGFNGDRPSHPELLDWLAVEFMNNGWSLKWLHRQILSSRAYRQSSRFNERAHAVDAANRLLWRMIPRRMDAETLRDSMLAASGSLNPERGGPSFVLQKKQTRGSYLYLAQDENDPKFWRRSIYKFAARGAERVFMDSFDCPDPAVATPQRSVSNTPVQALALLNNTFVLRQAELLATRLKAAADPIAEAYRILLQRAPSGRERDLGARYTAEHGLALFCRTLFNTNEFVYVP